MTAMQYTMKDSGVPWTFEVSSSWEIRRLKTLLKVLRGGSPRPIEEYLTDAPDGINWIKIGDTVKGQKTICQTKQKIKPSGMAKSRLVHNGDLLLTNSMSFGEPYFLEVDGCIHDGWVCLTDLKEINKLFLYYYLRSDFCTTQFNLQVDGGVVQNLNIDKIGEAYIFLPPLPEQEAIAAYLDEKCGAIDGIIAEAKATIEEYKTWKASVIFEAVTKGLDPNAEMKDSGVDIIGLMPAYWQLQRQRFLCKTTTGDHDTQDADPDGEYNFYVRSPIVERSNSYTFEGESVLMAGDGAGAGRVFHHATGKYAIHQRVYCFYDFKDILPCFYHYFMSILFSTEMDKGSAKSTVPSVRLPMLKDFRICLPDISEQKRIVEHLDRQCSAIDAIIGEKQTLIDDLELYKKSLIFETVTGKRRVC